MKGTRSNQICCVRLSRESPESTCDIRSFSDFPVARFSIDDICRNLLTVERIEQHEDTSELKAKGCVNFRFYLERQREKKKRMTICQVDRQKKENSIISNMPRRLRPCVREKHWHDDQTALSRDTSKYHSFSFAWPP